MYSVVFWAELLQNYFILMSLYLKSRPQNKTSRMALYSLSFFLSFSLSLSRFAVRYSQFCTFQEVPAAREGGAGGDRETASSQSAGYDTRGAEELLHAASRLGLQE